MKLYYAPGACSLSPHIVLRELGLPFGLEAVDLKTKRTAGGADFAALNPKGYVPALQLEDDEVLTEGVAIIQYLADKHAPGTLAPAAGTIERARLNSHLNYLSAELHPAFGALFNPALAPEAHEAALAKLGRKLAVMETAFADGRDHLLGADFSIADAYLFVILSWAPMLGVGLARWPRLQSFGARVATRASVEAAMATEGLLKAA
jgi:glutathione S-transferase